MTSQLHQRLLGDRPATRPERLLALLFDRLWDDYRRRVPHVAAYERVIAAAGATFVNDHIAFRTLASQSPLLGIPSLSRIFQALGYREAGCYVFPGKHLGAIHLQHARREFPKIFISELRLWELTGDAQQAASASLASHRTSVDNALLSELAGELPSSNEGVARQADRLAAEFTRPWAPPAWTDVQTMNAESQYGAWTMLHGYRVNHFTALVNSHRGSRLETIDATVAALREAGVPMKLAIEGAAGSKLRQTATAAADSQVEVVEDGVVVSKPWTYAYFELAERGAVQNPETGEAAQFEGFLGPQAAELFEMTKQ